MLLCTQTRFLHVKSVSLFVLFQNKSNGLFFPPVPIQSELITQGGFFTFESWNQQPPYGKPQKALTFKVNSCFRLELGLE